MAALAKEPNDEPAEAIVSKDRKSYHSMLRRPASQPCWKAATQ